MANRIYFMLISVAQKCTGKLIATLPSCWSRSQEVTRERSAVLRATRQHSPLSQDGDDTGGWQGAFIYMHHAIIITSLSIYPKPAISALNFQYACVTATWFL